MYREATTLHPLLRPAVEGLGYELVGIVRLQGRRGATVRIYIDRPEGITLEDCERASRQVSAVLDVEDAVRGQYTLEVSSPGLDRPLFLPEHYEQYAGREVKLTLEQLIDGRRRLTGKLLGISGDEIVVLEAGREYRVPYAVVESARLIPQAV